MHTVFALLCFVVVLHWLIFQYPSGLLHWHCGNLTIAPVPAKQPWWIWINTSYEFIMNDCINTTKQSTTKPCAYFLGYTVQSNYHWCWLALASTVSQSFNERWGIKFWNTWTAHRSFHCHSISKAFLGCYKIHDQFPHLAIAVSVIGGGKQRSRLAGWVQLSAEAAPGLQWVPLRNPERWYK